MTSDSLYRAAGLGLLVGGIIAGAGDLGHNLLSKEPASTAATAAALAAIVGSLLVVMCLPALAVRLAERAGVIGLLGYGLLIEGFVIFGVGGQMLNAFVDPIQPPDLAAQPPVGLIATFMLTELGATVGLILLGVATLRARVSRRGSAGPLRWPARYWW